MYFHKRERKKKIKDFDKKKSVSVFIGLPWASLNTLKLFWQNGIFLNVNLKLGFPKAKNAKVNKSKKISLKKRFPK